MKATRNRPKSGGAFRVYILLLKSGNGKIYVDIGRRIIHREKAVEMTDVRRPLVPQAVWGVCLRLCLQTQTV